MVVVVVSVFELDEDFVASELESSQAVIIPTVSTVANTNDKNFFIKFSSSNYFVVIFQQIYYTTACSVCQYYDIQYIYKLFVHNV